MDLPLPRHRGRIAGRVLARTRLLLGSVPGLQRLVDDLARVELIDRCMVIAAQALLALVPLVIALVAYLPPDVTAAFLARLEVVTGSATTTANAVRVPGTSDEVRSETGVVALALTLLSAVSFGRAMQRTFERVWGVRHIGGFVGARRNLLWLLGWLLALEGTALVASWVREVQVLRLCVQLLGAVLVWWWTPYVLLQGRVTWARLLPGAVVTGVVLVVYVVGSGLIMPRYAEVSAAQLGSLGLVLTGMSWLIGFAFVVVLGAVVGRVLAEEPRLRRLGVPLARLLAGRPR